MVTLQNEVFLLNNIIILIHIFSEDLESSFHINFNFYGILKRKGQLLFFVFWINYYGFMFATSTKSCAFFDLPLKE